MLFLFIWVQHIQVWHDQSVKRKNWNLCWRFQTGVFSGLESPCAHSGKLRLEDWHSSAGRGQEFKCGLQRWTESRMSLHRLAEHLRQTLQQILDKLQQKHFVVDTSACTRNPQCVSWCMMRYDEGVDVLTSLPSLRLTKRLSGVGIKTSEGQKVGKDFTLLSWCGGTACRPFI